MLNSPVNFNDPTGHESVCGQANSDPECGDLGHTPSSHPKPPTKPVGKEKVKEVKADPWEYSFHVAKGFHVGPTSDIFVPEYNSDDYNGFPFVFNENSDDNFWVAYDLKYNESIGITISNIRILNQSDYPVFLNDIHFESSGKSVYPQIPNLGMYNDLSQGITFVPDPPKFNGDNNIVIKFEMGWNVNVGQGPFQIYPDYEIVVPSLPDAKEFVETVEFLLDSPCCLKAICFLFWSC